MTCRSDQTLPARSDPSRAKVAAPKFSPLMRWFGLVRDPSLPVLRQSSAGDHPGRDRIVTPARDEAPLDRSPRTTRQRRSGGSRRGVGRDARRRRPSRSMVARAPAGGRDRHPDPAVPAGCVAGRPGLPAAADPAAAAGCLPAGSCPPRVCVNAAVLAGMTVLGGGAAYSAVESSQHLSAWDASRRPGRRRGRRSGHRRRRPAWRGSGRPRE